MKVLLSITVYAIGGGLHGDTIDNACVMTMAKVKSHDLDKWYLHKTVHLKSLSVAHNFSCHVNIYIVSPGHHIHRPSVFVNGLTRCCFT